MKKQRIVKIYGSLLRAKSGYIKLLEQCKREGIACTRTKEKDTIQYVECNEGEACETTVHFHSIQNLPEYRGWKVDTVWIDEAELETHKKVQCPLHACDTDKNKVLSKIKQTIKCRRMGSNKMNEEEEEDKTCSCFAYTCGECLCGAWDDCPGCEDCVPDFWGDDDEN